MKIVNRPSIAVKPYTMGELLIIYGVSRNTFKSWIAKLELGKRIGHYYSTQQINLIFRSFPPPHEILFDPNE